MLRIFANIKIFINGMVIEKIITNFCILLNTIFVKFSSGKNPPLEINVMLKFSELKSLISVKESKKNITIDILNYKKSGEKFWNRLRIKPLFDEKGNLIYRYSCF